MKKIFSILSIAALLLICNFQLDAKQPPTTKLPTVERNEAGNPIQSTHSAVQDASTDEPDPTPDAPADTVGAVKEIDGKQFIIVAKEIDKTTGQIVTIIKEYKDNQAAGGSLIEFLVFLFSSGALGTILTQIAKNSKMIISFVNGINRPIRVAFWVAGAITAGWTGFETGFQFTDFSFVAFATRWLLVFGPTLLAYEFVVRYIVKKPAEPAQATA